MVSQAPPSDADLERQPTARDKLRAAIAVPGRLLAALFLPDRGMPAAVRHGGYGWALVVVTLAALVQAAAVGVRLDTSRQVIERLPKKPPVADAKQAQDNGEQMSDREIGEAIAKERAVAQVKAGLGAGIGTPASVFFLALGLFLLGRFVGGQITVRSATVVAAHASLPGAVSALIAAVAATRHVSLLPEQAQALVSLPMPGPAGPALAALPFGLWTLVLLFFGFAEAGKMSRLKAFLVLLAAVIFMALLGLACSGGGPPPPHSGSPR